MATTYFSWVPNVLIKGKTTQKINSSALNSIQVDNHSIQITLNKNYKKDLDLNSDYLIIKFNENPGIHSFSQPANEEFPLELAYAYSIDLLEYLSEKLNVSTIMYPFFPESYIEALFGLNNKVWIPFLIRRPGKTLYTSVFLLTPLTGNLLLPLESFSDQYEDYIDNALFTFQQNVVRPLRHIKYAFNPDDLVRVLDRSEDLNSIISEQIKNIRERYRSFSRLIVPLIHYASLKSEMESSIYLKRESNNVFRHELRSPREIESAELASIIAKKLAD